ncbi:acyltransferase family protein [Pseudomonas sp. NPDC007930]|uniref:acyltransferase family protein n=1 Tax=Pseudomonas sp. NPDC007930 TaxID=3364417 RepID=UPI0036E5B8E4
MPEPNTPPQPNNHYPNFDVIRILLAIEVVWAHIWEQLDPSNGWNGFIRAVPAFLAVSGFLVLKSYSETPLWRVFAIKRALRIFPALLTALAVGYAFFGYRFFVGSVYQWATGGLISVSPNNGSLWSLAWEELAYISLAVLWSLGAYKKPAYLWILLTTSYALSLLVLSWHIAPRYYVISLLPLSFIIGNLMFIYRHHLDRLGSSAPWLCLVITCAWAYIPFPGTEPDMAPAILQAFSVVWVGVSGRRLVKIKFPDISYGLYVYNIPVIWFAVQFYDSNTPSTWIFLLFGVFSISVASWYLIEKPSLKLKNRFDYRNKLANKRDKARNYSS